MSTFPGSASEFYALRDDRTNRCVDRHSYQQTQCTLHLGHRASSTRRGQVAFLAAANLLSRWCRHVELVTPTRVLHPELGLGDSDLADFALRQMRNADPFGTFRRRSDDDTTSAGIALCVGDAIPSGVPSTVFVASGGWLGALSLDSPMELEGGGDKNCLGALAAAALGVAQTFKVALGLPRECLLRDGVFDLFRLGWTTTGETGPWPTDTALGRVLMVGAGSVGSSAAYCMRLASLGGHVTVLDKDIVKIENFNRSPLFDRNTLGLTKAEATKRFLSGSAIDCEPLGIWWKDFVETWNRADWAFDVWLPLANEFGVRHSMQHNVPPLMIHASTTANWGVNHSRHLPTADDCLVDRFPASASVNNLACATAAVSVDEVTVDAALPFSSFFAGLLVVADLVRGNLPGYPQVPNFALFDWFGSMETIQAWDRRPRPECICRRQDRHFHERFNGGTKHWPSFRFER